MKICFASHNQNKVREIAQLAPPEIEIFGLNDLEVTEEIPETGETMEENSRIKAAYVHANFGVPVFADDSGLEVYSLGGEPGVYSARYAGLEKDAQKNIDLLLSKLSDKNDKSARFKAVITLIETDGKEHQFTGTVDGHIIEDQRGTNGFGYDPIFIPEGYDRTFAELDSEVKNSLSHRARAFQQLLLYLKGIK